MLRPDRRARDRLGQKTRAGGNVSMESFRHTPRDAVANNTGITNQDIGRILDHQPEDANGATVIYNVAEQVKQTKLGRPTLNHLDRLLRGIIGASPDKVVKLPRKAA
jgi:hypothetical protein